MIKDIRTIGVHDGTFHPDDVVAVALLLHCNKLRVSDVTIIRTRNNQLLEECDVILDVGRKYEDKWFDHHQLEGNDRSALGLLADELYKDNQEVLNLLKREFITAIELTDNGQNTNLSNPFSWIDFFNVNWDESPIMQYKKFIEAVELSIKILDKIFNKVNSLIRSKEVIQEAKIEFDGKVIILDTSVPWQEYVHEEYPEALYVVFENMNKDAWMIQGVPVKPGRFELKKPFPESWRGKDDYDFEEACGIEGAIFCHKAGFLCSFREKYQCMLALNSILK